jgi:hypothetical protein
VFYYAHIEEVPVSGRRRFIFFSEATVEEDGSALYRQIMSKGEQEGAILPSWDPRSRKVARVMNRLIEGGDLQHVNWEVHVLESPRKWRELSPWHD